MFKDTVNAEETRWFGGFVFPAPQCSKETIDQWEDDIRRRAIHHQVLVVAKTRIEGKWNAYVFPVAGQSHDKEWRAWETEGSKLTEEVALAIFPEFKGVPYAT